MMIDINRSHFTEGIPGREECMQNLVRITHRRDLYEFLLEQYAELREWDVSATIEEGLQQLDRFEHRRFRL